MRRIYRRRSNFYPVFFSLSKKKIYFRQEELDDIEREAMLLNRLVNQVGVSVE